MTPKPMLRPYTMIPGTVVRIDVTWLDGGLKDDFPVVTPYPARLDDLAAALESFDGGDGGHEHAARALRSVTSRDVVANSPTRFAAVVGDELEIYRPYGKCLIEIQDLPTCATTGFILEGGDGDHLIDMKGVK